MRKTAEDMSAKERGDQNAVVDALRSIQPAVFIPASVVIVAMIAVSVVYFRANKLECVRSAELRDHRGGVGVCAILAATGLWWSRCTAHFPDYIRLGRDDELPRSSASGHGWQC